MYKFILIVGVIYYNIRASVVFVRYFLLCPIEKNYWNIRLDLAIGTFIFEIWKNAGVKYA